MAERTSRAIAIPLEPVLAPFDAIRARLLRALAPAARSFVVDRERRVALAGTCLVLVALVSASTIPIWVIAIGPLVWGVPHVLSDFRYLVARPRLHRRWPVALILGGGTLAAALELRVQGALLTAAALMIVSRGAPLRRAIVAAVALGLFAIARTIGFTADLLFAQLHNAVAVVLWLAWRRRGSRASLVPLAAIALGVVVLLSGAALPLLARTGGLVSPLPGLSFEYLARTLSFERGLDQRLVALYAFGQTVHYVMWLCLLPEDDRPSPTPRSYAQSFRAVSKDLGPWLVGAGLLAALALAAWGVVDVARARNDYLQFAFFHGYLEVAAAALLFSEGRLGVPARGELRACDDGAVRVNALSA